VEVQQQARLHFTQVDIHQTIKTTSYEPQTRHSKTMQMQNSYCLSTVPLYIPFLHHIVPKRTTHHLWLSFCYWGSGLFISTGRAWGVLYRMSLPLLYMNVFYGTQYDPTVLLFRKIFPAAPLYYLKHFIYFICYITTIPFYMFDKYSYPTDTTFEYYRTTA
jgi:hypothetical protein